MTALPDLEIEVRQKHVTYEAVLIEVQIAAHTLANGKAFLR
jgi:hypothetical protein